MSPALAGGLQQPPGMPPDWTEETHGPHDPSKPESWNALPWCPPFVELRSLTPTPTPPSVPTGATCKVRNGIVDSSLRTAGGIPSHQVIITIPAPVTEVPPTIPSIWTEETHGPYDSSKSALWNSLPWCPPFERSLTPTPVPNFDEDHDGPSCKIRSRTFDLTNADAVSLPSMPASSRFFRSPTPTRSLDQLSSSPLDGIDETRSSVDPNSLPWCPPFEKSLTPTPPPNFDSEPVCKTKSIAASSNRGSPASGASSYGWYDPDS